MRTIFHESENSNYIPTRALSPKTCRPPCLSPSSCSCVSIVIAMSVSPQCPDVMRIGNEDIRNPVTHAVRLSQTDDWFVSLFPIVANVLIITLANDIISQSEAGIRPDLTNQRPGRGHYYTPPVSKPISSCPAVVT